MKNYLTYKEEIHGFTEVSETVKAEEKVAASYIGRLRREAASLDVYQTNIRRMLDRLAAFYRMEEQKQKEKGKSAIARGKSKKTLIVLMSDKGLTGGLWRRMVDEFLKTAGQTYSTVIAVGSRGLKYFEEEKVNVGKSFETDENAFQYVAENFRTKLFSAVDILYPEFISLLEQKPVIVPFLPFVADETEAASGLPIIIPTGKKETLFAELVEKYRSSYFKKVAVERKLSEYAARTVAMEHASVKTDELIKSLTLEYRKERRRSLTQKQLESFVAHTII